MFKVHAYLGSNRVIDWRMEHLPRMGDTIRLHGDRYATVTKVVWCLDEADGRGTRVNLEFTPITEIES